MRRRTLYPVRAMGSGITHAIDAPMLWINDAQSFGAPYKRVKPPVTALCGVVLTGVHALAWMQTAPNCRVCLRLVSFGDKMLAWTPPELALAGAELYAEHTGHPEYANEENGSE